MTETLAMPLASWLRSLKACLDGTSLSRPTRRRSFLRRPDLCRLEDRCLPAAYLVKDINPGGSYAGSDLRNFTTVGATLFFTAYDLTHGMELWKSDGTAAGTVLVKDINPGPGSSQPFNLTAVNGVLYFRAEDGQYGYELWRSDGTGDGTYMVKDIFPGSGSSAPASVLGGVDRSSNLHTIAAVGNTLFFSATDGSGAQLWKTDGTAAGTVIVTRIGPNSGDALGGPHVLTAFNGVLYFVGTDERGSELWRSDGTAEGTYFVKDIDTAASDFGDAQPNGLIVFNNALFFFARDGVNGRQLWKTDGTPAGTIRVSDYGAGTSNPGLPAAEESTLAVGSTLFFPGFSSLGRELWRSDGTAAGTGLLKDIFPGVQSSNVSSFVSLNNVLYCGADDGPHGYELWRSDGTAAGTYLVRDIRPGPLGAGVGVSATMGGFVYFFADAGGTVSKLWRSDGTAAGTTPIQDIIPPGMLSYIGEMVALNGTLFFSNNDGVHGIELWAYRDGQAPPPPPPPVRRAQLLVTGADKGGDPRVRVFAAATGTPRFDIAAYNAGFRGGVRVAVGDVDGDGTDDIITAPGPGGGPHIRVFSGADGHPLASFFAYAGSFTAGVYIAAADIDGDSRADIATGAGEGGGPHIQVFSGKTFQPLRSFMAYAAGFTGGIRVAAGDVNGDGVPDLITGTGPGGGPHVQAFSGKDGSLLRSFMAYDPGFRGGLFVAAGDVTGDGAADIVTAAGRGGGPHVQVFDGRNPAAAPVASFFAYDAAFRGGARVAAADFDGDGRADLITAAGPGGAPHVRVRRCPGLQDLYGMLVYDPAFLGGVFVGT
jgi:ELWxxDGT repeat protein